MDVSFTWSEAKRESSFAKHGLDFVDAPRVFDGATVTVEDRRFWYDERRFMTLGRLNGTPVSIIHTVHDKEIRIISFRRATRSESHTHFEEVAH